MNEADNVEVAVEATEAPVTERPEWLPEKFNTPEDLVSSYGNLESKLGKGEEELRATIQRELEVSALENRPATVGDYQIPDSIDASEVSDNDLFKWWADHSFENGYSQEQFEGGIAKYAEALQGNVPDLEAEHRALGENADARIEATNLWANQFFPEELHDAFITMGQTAVGIKALEHIMSKVSQPNMGASSQPAESITLSELQTKQKDPRYWNPAKRDAAFVKEVDEGFSKLYG